MTTEELIAQLKADDPSQREQAALELGNRRATEALDALIAALDDPVGAVRCAVILALRYINHPRGDIALIPLFNDTDNAVRRRVSAWAMTREGEQPHLVEPLIAQLRDPDSRKSTIDFILMLLGKWGDARALEALHDMTQHEFAPFRLRAAQSLRKMADASSVVYLTPLLNDPHPGVQATAAKTLTAIGTPEALSAVSNWKAQNSMPG
ncbi:MAG: hypothetical protein Kow00117_21000 [Phototrophicales bacterium]